MTVLAVSIVLSLAGYAVLALTRRTARAATSDAMLMERFPGVLLVFDRRLRHTDALGLGLRAMNVEPRGRTLHEAFPDDVRIVLEPAYRAALEGRETQLELPLAGRDWVVTVSPLGGETGLLTATDVTERKRRERRLAELATKDALTGVANRRRLQEELDWLARRGGTASLLVLDLDGFKAVNDALGHAAGDELLRRVVTAVQGCVRRADLVARLGGDEFAVLLPGATPDEARRVAAKVRDAITAVWPLGVRGGVSIGVSQAGVGSGDALGRADRAMYADKRGALQRLAS